MISSFPYTNGPFSLMANRADADEGLASVRSGSKDVAAKFAKKARRFCTTPLLSFDDLASLSLVGEEKRELSNDALGVGASDRCWCTAVVLGPVTLLLNA